MGKCEVQWSELSAKATEMLIIELVWLPVEEEWVGREIKTDTEIKVNYQRFSYLHGMLTDSGEKLHNR